MLQPWLCGAALVAIAWGLAVWWTTGFYWQIGFLRISSRDPVRPFVIAAVCGVSCWLVDPRRAAAATARLAERWMARVAPAVFVLGVVLLVAQWGVGRPFWTDEEMVAMSIRDRGFLDLARPLALDQSAPYGWLVLERAAVLIGGTSERALRFVPLLFGVGLLTLAFWVGRRWMTSLGTAALLVSCALGEWLTFYCLELKPYSSDMFWALLVAAMAAWVVEAPSDRRQFLRRAAAWWTVAAVGLWCGNGALYVAPGSAFVLLYNSWRRGRLALAVRFCLLGTLWFVSFGLEYVVSLRPTLNDAFMASFWREYMPPRSAGPLETMQWLGAQLRPLALKPGGVEYWIAFWAVAVGGFMLFARAHAAAGLLFALTPLAAFALAACRLVPLYERLSIWMVPSLYVGIAYAVDRLPDVFRGAVSFRTSRARLVAAALASGGLAVSINLANRGIVNVRFGRPSDSNHQLDDRAALAHLLAFRRPGDAYMSTRLGLPAVWWYGGIAGGAREYDASRQADGGRVWAVSFDPDVRNCAQLEGLETLRDGGRLLVYFGFRFDDTPRQFDALLVDQLRRRGRIVSDRSFAESSRAVVVDLRPSAADAASESGKEMPTLPGCLTVAPAATR
jgi:hypothetical protein